MNKAIITYVLLLSMLIVGCAVDSTRYSPIPEIAFQKSESQLSKNADGIDTLFYVGLYFSLIDGNGDIGAVAIPDGDNIILPPTNCFVDLYYAQDGQFVKDTLLKATEYTIPYIPNEGQDKLLKADVIIDIPYSLSSQLLFPYDTIYYTIKVVDRANFESNIIFSDTIVYPR